MLDILGAAMMAAAAGLGCLAIIALVERSVPKEDAMPQAMIAEERPSAPLYPPKHDFIVSVTRYILPEPGTWDALEQSDAWRRFRQAVKEMQKGGPTRRARPGRARR